MVSKKRVMFSIVTVCYNSEATIKRTIESVLVQQNNDYEYIIIDGNSTDGTLGLIKSYEPCFEGRMRWISEPDKGIYDAFNKGCKMAQGKYVWIVNSDDFIQPDALQELSLIINGIKAERLPIISAAGNFLSKGATDFLKICKADECDIDRAYALDSIGVFHPATLVPKEVYERVGYFDDNYKIMGDLDWFQRSYQEREKFLFIDNIITNMTDGGVSNTFVFRKNAKDFKILLRKKYQNLFVRCIHFGKWSILFYRMKYATDGKKHTFLNWLWHKYVKHLFGR